MVCQNSIHRQARAPRVAVVGVRCMEELRVAGHEIAAAQWHVDFPNQAPERRVTPRYSDDFAQAHNHTTANQIRARVLQLRDSRSWHRREPGRSRQPS